MLVQEFEGKTEEEAIQVALESLELSEDQIRVETVDLDSKIGFFGFRNRKLVRIKVYYEEVTGSKIADLAKRSVEDLLEKMQFKSKVSIIQEDEERVYLGIISDQSALLIGKRGKNLEAIQLFINIALSQNKEVENMKKVVLDVEGYLNRRKESVSRMALRAADYVRTSKKSRILDPMNPFERRWVHLTLQDIQDIGTKSEGNGVHKKVRIFLRNPD